MLRLKELRKSHEPPLSQENLAQRANVSVKTVVRAEKVGSASTATLLSVARALGVSISDLFEEAS